MVIIIANHSQFSRRRHWCVRIRSLSPLILLTRTLSSSPSHGATSCATGNVVERPLRLDLDKPEEPENQAQFALSLYQGDIVCESDAGMMNLCTAFSNSSRRSRSYLMRRDPYLELCCSGWKSSHRRGANTDAEVHQRCVEGEGVVRSNTVLFGCDILLILYCFLCIVLSCLLGQTGAHRCKK
jgi:hypothetical protein